MTIPITPRMLCSVFSSVLLAGCAAQSAVKPDNNPTEAAQTDVSNAQTQAKAPSAAQGTVSASSSDGTTYEYTLDNGLKIVVKPDHRAPVAVSQVWYKVGSSYETNGKTGVAHVLEHMMFKGTEKHGPNDFSKIIAENGGNENAFTGQDYTAYFQQLEKSRINISFELEADRMQNLNLAAEEFAKEIQVVMEERRMRTDDNPKAKVYEQFMAAAFVNSPYHHPIIGWMDDLKNMTVQDAQDWYSYWYAPNNAILVVVGDVEPQEVLEQAKKFYGALGKRDVPTLKPQNEVQQNGMRRIVVKEPAQLPYLLMGYKVPVLRSATEEWEPYALAMLSYVLDGSDSARFNKYLIRGDQIAAEAGAGYDLYSRMEDLFTFDGTPAKGHSIEELEQAIRNQIKRVQNELVSEDELQRIKAQVVANKIYELDSVFYQAMKIGTLEAVGLDWQVLDQFVDKLRAVTPEQLQIVAQKYLIDDRLTVAVLDPQPIGTMTANAGHSPSNGGIHGN